jgi:hypothetical protein
MITAIIERELGENFISLLTYELHQFRAGLADPASSLAIS